MAEQIRVPIVTILGHVDHGKTSLLDYIRKANVAAREHGGITQHIGAYQAEHEGKLITFIDTPGHAAFEKMRSRGAKVADIAVLVVAVDDGIMPQTIEAIKHIQEAKVPMIVAVNKVDLPGINLQAQVEKIKRQLSDNKVLIEEYGGDVPIVQISAKTGLGVDKLLEMILLVAEVNELKGDPSLPAAGVVIEANMDKFKGPVATLLIRNGTLRRGDQIVLGGIKGKIRALMNYLGKPLEEAGPSTPVEIQGLEAVPMVGATLGQVGTQEGTFIAKNLSLIERLKQGESNALNVILKADKQGSLEAIIEALEKFNADKEAVKIVSSGTGDIMEGDIEMATVAHAIVVGFNNKLTPAASRMADSERVLVRNYTIIYELLDELSEVIEEMMVKGALEEVYGTAQILAEFPFGKNEKIAGCRIVDGAIAKGPKIRIVRGQEVVGETKIKSLKKGKDEVSKLEKGQECGMIFDPFVDFQIGDVVESYRTL